MKRTEWLQQTRLMRFEEAYEGWQVKRLTQDEAARLLGVCERTFRRYIDRFEEEGLDGLMDQRITAVSQRKAPVDEVLRHEALYKQRYDGWTVKHFFERHQDEHKGTRSYSWVKNQLQAAALAAKCKRRGPHRKRRPRSPMPGLMIHQDGSSHEWIKGQSWDLIVTMDDATSEIYSGFLWKKKAPSQAFVGSRRPW